MKRLTLGTIILLIMVGEVTVALKNGLMTLPGLISLLLLYLLLFLLYEALASHIKLTNGHLVLITYGIYSVFITGLLHGEIANYVTKPQDALITTLIRIQCSFFVIFAYQLINKISSRPSIPKVKLSFVLFYFIIYILLLTPTKQFGLIVLINTFRVAPIHSILFSISAIIAIIFSLHKPIIKPTNYSSKIFSVLTWFLFVICLIPSVKIFLIIVVIMPIIAIYYLLKPAFRNNKI